MKIRLKDQGYFEELLIRKGHSKRSFAEAANIGQVTALQIANGDRNPSPRIAKRITEALEVEFDEIFVIEKPACSKA
ncbi:helix-turn-helix transcriptional regulator [Brevibacillus antibioticus]|uniref:Helix-turn-helix transcriptional regulator n=1 Tax=Brevibacillus antibioticus TaxID=2570228 RepID=A0A4U2Y282_9BACL|nr:helix-turn-helix transcriptional regulator [Brevibacillus antibioticus]TKI54528.1 helix-turn-helix transcriptional regulator [Brevibacillus antibioticus]